MRKKRVSLVVVSVVLLLLLTACDVSSYIEKSKNLHRPIGGGLPALLQHEGRTYIAEPDPDHDAICQLELTQVGVIESTVGSNDAPSEDHQINRIHYLGQPYFTAVSDEFDYSDYLFVQNPNGSYSAYKVYQLSDSGS